MRVRRAHLTGVGQSFSEAYCNMFGKAYDSNSGLCIAQAEAMIPSYQTSTGGPPVGYAGATPAGAIPSNPLGITTYESPAGSPVQQPADILAAEEAINAQNKKLCEQQGKIWNPNTGQCQTDWTPWIWAGVAIGGLFFLMAVKR